MLIADVGDNLRQRKSYSMYVVAEPARLSTATSGGFKLSPAWRIDFAYEDNARDCEAVAVDTLQARVLLLSKRSVPAVLYEVPLLPSKAGSLLNARRLLSLPKILQATAMDITADGSAVAVLSYKSLVLFERKPQQDLISMMRGPFRLLEVPRLAQPEAICFSPEGRALYISSEKTPAPLLRLNLETK